MNQVLYLVIPCYNEEEVLPTTANVLRESVTSMIQAGKIAPESKILFVNDGSKDKTWEIIRSLYESDPMVGGICLSRNKGHQNALIAGMTAARDYADMIITLDADLQDDVGAVERMVEEYLQGSEVVYGVRSSRKKDSFFKRFTAESFYRIMRLMGVEVVFNHADYRLMSRRAVDALLEFQEVNLFLRGIVPLIGFKTATVEYERNERFAGESKYPLKKMLSFAFDGITSFSVKPIRLITVLGFLLFLASIAVIIYSVVIRYFGRTVWGWASTIGSIWMIGGIQLFCLGMIGEYIGKIYQETKRRPRYFISDFLIHAEKKEEAAASDPTE